MGPESETIFPSFDLSDSEQKNHKVILSHFDKHFVPTVNEIHERGKFFLRDQLSDETIEQYIREIYSLAENCNFKTFKEEFIRDRLVLGMRDKVTSKQLQMTPDLSLQKAIEVARAAELIQVQMAAQLHEPTVDAVSASKRKPRSHQEDASSKACCTCKCNSNSVSEDSCNPCGNCGSEHPKGQCPARGFLCNFCKKPNHFEKVCRRKKRNEACELQQAAPEDNSFFLGSIATQRSRNPWTVNLNILSNKLNFNVDSGADLTCISL